MIKLSDFKGIFQTANLNLEFSGEIKDEIQVFDFSFPRDITWQAGDHGIFTLRGTRGKGRNFRAFSVASIPAEGVIKVATRILQSSPSPFKQSLSAMKPGENISIRGPFGWMKFRDENTPVVAICGGLGITPFRAMLMGTNKTRQITLIYHNSHSSHLFRPELEEIAAGNNKVKISFLSEREETHREIEAACEKYGAGAWYCLSGNPKALKSWKKRLKQGRVPSRRIMSDIFFGY